MVAVTDSHELLAPAIASLEASGIPVEALPSGLTPVEAARRVAGARVVLTGVLPFHREAIAALEGVDLLIRCGVGVDIIDVAAASDRGILVANVPDYCVSEVADHTLLLILAVARRVELFREQVRSGHWTTSSFPEVRRLSGRTAGIVGLGRIGTEVARRVRAIGMTVIASDPYADPSRFENAVAGPVDLPKLLSESDVISLHIPLTNETRHLLDVRAFDKVRGGSIVINTSRGGLVDLEALDAAIESGRVAGAGLDVLDGEPTPDLTGRLLSRQNVFTTPHVAWYSSDARVELGRRAADIAIGFLNGEVPVVINLAAVQRAGASKS